MQIMTTSHQLAQRGVAYAPQIVGAAQRHGLDPALLAAVAAQETGGPGSNRGANIVGDGGHGHGIFQIDDRWHSFAQNAAAMDPAKNADYAAGMISGLLHRYGGNVKAALSAYNAGSPDATGTTTRWRDGSVLGYADSVLRHYRNIVGSSGPPQSAAPGVLEESQAEQPTVIASVEALAGQASAVPLILPSLPNSHGQSQGTDSTGHSRDPKIAVADLIA